MRHVNKLTELLLLFENIIFDNEYAFITRFCSESTDQVREVLSVFFSSEIVKVYYMTDRLDTESVDIAQQDFERWIDVIAPNF